MINLIENVRSTDDMEDLVNFLGHFYFDNILIQKPEKDEVLPIIFLLMEKEVESLNTPSVSSFLDRSFLGRFLKSLTRRQDIKSYLAMTLGDLIMQMENSTENFLEVDPNRIYQHIKKEKGVTDKSFNIEKTKKIFDMDRKLLLGDRVRKTTIMKKKMSVEKEDPKSIQLNSEEPQSTLPFHQNKIDNLNEERKNSLLFLEDLPLNFYDEVDVPSENEINNDYLIDLTEDELRFRSDKEDNFLMKEYCIFIFI
jgi:hypothetical protein